MSSYTKVSFIEVTADQAGQRLDNFLRVRCKNLPKSHLYRIIRKGEVRVNKKRIDPDYRLQAHDNIRIPPLQDINTRKPTKPSEAIQERLAQRILYEDDQLLVLHKPAGLAVHTGSGVRIGIIDIMRALKPQEKYLELAHRIDRETSGCLLFSKKPSMLRELHALMREGKIKKTYILLVKGYWPNHLRIIDTPLEGKPGLTEFRIEKRFKETTLLKAYPATGRNHQIRLHAMAAGFPLVGDKKYGDFTFNRFMKSYGCERLFLHAAQLEFTVPSTGKTITVDAPLDEDLQKCLERLVK